MNKFGLAAYPKTDPFSRHKVVMSAKPPGRGEPLREDSESILMDMVEILECDK